MKPKVSWSSSYPKNESDGIGEKNAERRYVSGRTRSPRESHDQRIEKVPERSVVTEKKISMSTVVTSASITLVNWNGNTTFGMRKNGSKNAKSERIRVDHPSRRSVPKRDDMGVGSIGERN